MVSGRLTFLKAKLAKNIENNKTKMGESTTDEEDHQDVLHHSRSAEDPEDFTEAPRNMFLIKSNPEQEEPSGINLKTSCVDKKLNQGFELRSCP